MKKNATKKGAPRKQPSKMITMSEAELNRVGLGIVRAMEQILDGYATLLKAIDRLRRARDGARP